MLKLWEHALDPAVPADGLTVDQAVDLMSSGSAVALVAEVDEEIVGMTVGAHRQLWAGSTASRSCRSAPTAG